MVVLFPAALLASILSLMVGSRSNALSALIIVMLSVSVILVLVVR